LVLNLYSGYAKGKLSLELNKRTPEEILKFHPEIRSMLEAIKEKGWKYLYIETKGRAVAEVDLEKNPCKLMPYAEYGGRGYWTIDVEIEKPPETKDVPEVQEFRINVCTKSFPRAATVDLSKGVITYLHDPFWKWESGWEKDPKKLSEAKEVYDVAKWLLEDKKLKLHENMSIERYKEICKILEEFIKQ